MNLNIDLSGKKLVVTQIPEPKLDQSGIQRRNKADETPMWATQVVVTDESGGEVIRINTSGEPPDVQVGDVVKVSNLVAIPWATNGRSGVAFRADAIAAMT